MPIVDTSVTVDGNKLKVDESVRQGVSQELVDEIVKALKSVKGWGSIEIYVQDFSVTQITTRNIKKTKHVLAE